MGFSQPSPRDDGIGNKADISESLVETSLVHVVVWDASSQPLTLSLFTE